MHTQSNRLRRDWTSLALAWFVALAACEESPASGPPGNAGLPDAGNPGSLDAGSDGSTNVDAATTLDASLPPPADGGNLPKQDASSSNDASSDASPGSADACQPFVMPSDCTIPDGAVLPGELRCTGLYDDWNSRKLACGVRSYKPAYELWSDAAGKQRYVWLPPGKTIDVKNPDEFVYPDGTLFWKEFHVGEPGKQRLGETRFMRKTDLGWIYTTYVWTEDLKNAVQENKGVANLFGTGHGVPTREQCKDCHSGRPDYVLGWDFVMLGPGAEGVTRESLAQAGLFSGMNPALKPLEIRIPGDDVERAALGYLHANCGISCHNNSVEAVGRPSALFLRLDLAQMASVQSTQAVTSGVNRRPAPNAELVGVPALSYYDFRPLDPRRTLSLVRMDFRGSPTAMPPIGTHRVDPQGISIITAWVNHMTEARGYPAPAQ